MDANAPLQLQGFNHLTKTLSFNGYNVTCTPTKTSRTAWQEHIAERYSCERLTGLLSEVAAMIGASVLNVASQTYTPQGASVTMLIAEQSIENSEAGDVSVADSQEAGLAPEHVVMHLDKSHLTVHTYPESDSESGISNVRVDIDISSCGLTTPLKTLNYLLQRFESDIVLIDYRVRGFARDVRGKKHFVDHNINSIEAFMAPDILQRYQLESINLCRESIFHTRMVRETFEVEDYLFALSASHYSKADLRRFKRRVFEEMSEIFHAHQCGG